MTSKINKEREYDCGYCRDTQYQYETYGWGAYTLACQHCQAELYEKQRMLLELELKLRDF